MLEFEPFSKAALKKALPYIRRNPSLCSDLSAGYLYMWHESADVRFCVSGDTLVVRQIIGGMPAFSYPIGADPRGMIDGLLEYARENGLQLRFFAVDDETLEKIRGDVRLRPAMWAYDRRWSDYIYSFGEAATFPGRKYGGQRNHVNKFKKLYGEPDVRFLTRDDLPAVRTMLAEYAEEHRDGQALERLELERTGALLDVCGELELYTAGLFVGDELAALSVGEIVGDMLLIHVEKALTRFEGVYPTMYSGFVRLVSESTGAPLAWVNREDDSGDPGIRTSKMQYHPVKMVNKHLVHIDSPAARVEPGITLFRGGVVLTGIRESDKEVYFALNTDVENNRYWGYDYREDLSISGPLNEDTFYDSVTYDMRAGDSVNFAVRLSEDGEMIGEAILWNFTADGAEVGCRIMREYQGKGYGTAAFSAAADYVAEHLKLKVRARCYRENTPSSRMIIASGFTPAGEDGEFCIFTRATDGQMKLSKKEENE